MKKMKMLGITALVSLTLAGCQNTSDREAALEDQVAQLEQQITSLEKENAADTSVSEENISVQDTSAQDTSQEASSDNTSSDDLDSLTKAVNDVVKKAENVDANGTNKENQTKFFEIKGELQEVENRLERYEDQIESSFRQDKLSYDEARDAEIAIERLEEELDNAEERLEYVFGYDD